MVERAADFIIAYHKIKDDFDAKVSYDEDQYQKPAQQKLLVHCRGGIGRSGTTISIINSIIQLKEQSMKMKLPVELKTTE